MFQGLLFFLRNLLQRLQGLILPFPENQFRFLFNKRKSPTMNKSFIFLSIPFPLTSRTEFLFTFSYFPFFSFFSFLFYTRRILFSFVVYFLYVCCFCSACFLYFISCIISFIFPSLSVVFLLAVFIN